MAGSVNKVILIGNLGRDPEVRSLQSGGKVVNFSIACTESWKGRDGEKQEKTEWVNVVIFNEGIAGVAERYLKKGSKVYVEGKLQTREWEKDGVKRYSTEVVLPQFRGELVLLGDGGGRGSRDNDDHHHNQDQPRENATGRSAPRNSRPADFDDSEIPF